MASNPESLRKSGTPKAEVPIDITASEKIGKILKVIQNFEATQAGDLALKAGDLITITAIVDENWYSKVN